MKINEIFYSIQGESTLVGLPTIFVRTSGCHLRCHYCDTKYAYYEGRQMTVDEILRAIGAFPCRQVCLTGGEPLLQKESLLLLSRLCNENYRVSLETSGDISCRQVDCRVRCIIDIKTPSSGELGRFNIENLNRYENSEFKFVIGTEEDFYWSEQFVKQFCIAEKFTVLYSPSFEIMDPRWLAEKILKEKSPARLQLQLHKYIWSPSTRGV